MSQGARIVQAIGHGQVLGVVGDGDVGQPAGQRRVGHLADGVAAIGGLGVHVQIAANVGEGDELRQGARMKSWQQRLRSRRSSRAARVE